MKDVEGGFSITIPRIFVLHCRHAISTKLSFFRRLMFDPVSWPYNEFSSCAPNPMIVQWPSIPRHGEHPWIVCIIVCVASTRKDNGKGATPDSGGWAVQFPGIGQDSNLSCPSVPLLLLLLLSLLLLLILCFYLTDCCWMPICSCRDPCFGQSVFLAETRGQIRV